MLRTPVCELLGMEVPIVQAAIWPATSPELVAAVCEAGGLGSIGAVFESAEGVREQMARVRSLTPRPFAVNHVVPMLDEEAFQATLEEKPEVVSFALGNPGGLVERAHEAGAKVVHQVHTVAQAREAAELGVDVIIAQGSEAGGQGMALGVGTMALVPQVVDAVDPVPVLAAGGVADGRGLAAALVLGAQGVNAGTRFLASEEASADEGWKRAILESESEEAVRFEVWKDLHRALARARRQGGKVALLFLDLDDFKLVNDSLGHQMGDRVLVAVAQRLKGCLRESDTAARLGGDEFAVLLEDVADESEAVGIAERFLTHMRVPLDLRGQQLHTTASIGIAVGSKEQPKGLVRAADLAMYQAKSTSGGHHVLFDPSTRG